MNLNDNNDKSKNDEEKIKNDGETKVEVIEEKNEKAKSEFSGYVVKKNKKKMIAMVSGILLILLVLVFSTVFALFNMNNTKTISRIKINGIDISKLSKEEASQKLNEIIGQKLEKDILLKTDNFEYGIKLSQIEVNYNIEKAIEEAYNLGRSGNIFLNNYEIAKTMIFGKDINLEYTYNDELLNKILDDISSKVPNAVLEANYCIEDDKLIITKGKVGNSIDKEEIKTKIIEKILINNNDLELDVQLIQKEPAAIDIDNIYSQVYTEPKDAYYTKNPFQIFPHVNGINFDIEAARKLLAEDKEEYEIPLTITTPKVTTNKIGTEAFPDLLSSFTTRYDASNYPRTTNLRLAMNKLNGVVVASGETFSYNKTLGKRTAEAGYREAGGYAGGRVVQTLAGGICQISSTLYDAVVYANLDIVERHNHMFLAGYVGAGKDATVVYGSLDFKFKNTRKYPIMIKTSIGNGVAKIDIYGIKEEVEYDVDIVSSILSYTPFKVIYEEDSSLAEGQQRVVQNGMNGCKSITYKVVKLNGSEVSRKVLSSDTYDPMNKIIKVGPKKAVQTTTTPEPKKPTTTTKPTETDKKEDNKKPTETQKPEESKKPEADKKPTKEPEQSVVNNTVNNVSNT